MDSNSVKHELMAEINKITSEIAEPRVSQRFLLDAIDKPNALM